MGFIILLTEKKIVQIDFLLFGPWSAIVIKIFMQHIIKKFSLERLIQILHLLYIEVRFILWFVIIEAVVQFINVFLCNTSNFISSLTELTTSVISSFGQLSRSQDKDCNEMKEICLYYWGQVGFFFFCEIIHRVRL